ncbi:MAG: hypothetical protein IKR65_09215 [Selenomonadaceae bacterium]|nr:hypothetical protein [Selenomonadaceae bacterium]
MKQIVNTNIRLDLSRADDRQTYEYLRSMDRKKLKSYTRAVVAALNDFFSRQEKRQDDPFLETREKEECFLRQVLDTIRAGIQESMGQVRVTLPPQPEQVAPLPSTVATDEENYEIAEAFLKDMGL